MQLPNWSCYCRNTTAVNALVFDLPNLRVFFSYKTPVAFHVLGSPVVVRENVYGRTTGRHLNAIDGGASGSAKSRVDGSTFERLLAEALGAESP